MLALRMGSPSDDSLNAPCLAGGGESGALMRSIDWSSSPLGAVSTWPASLQTMVSVMLVSKLPMHIVWGRDLIHLYNDAYRPILGASKYPGAMGGRADETFREVWPVVGPLFRRVFEGESVGLEDAQFSLDRNAYLEECYFTASYSPIRVGNTVGGVFGVVTETTQRVLAERRLGVLRQLASDVAAATSAEAACVRAAETLERNPADVPFALFYLTDIGGKSARLASFIGLGESAATSLQTVDLTEGEAGKGWPLRAAAEKGSGVLVTDVIARIGEHRGNPYPEAVHTAKVLPLLRSGQVQPYGFMVVGINPRRAIDDKLRDFFELVRGHVVAAITTARVFAELQNRLGNLAELTRSKDEFLAMLGHELRNPLAPISTALHLMRQRAGDTHDRERLVIERQIKHLTAMVDDLLDVSRITQGKVELDRRPMQLLDVVSSAVEIASHVVEERRQHLTVDVAATGLAVNADRARLAQAITNLLTNAAKYTPRGGKIDVAAAAEGTEVVLRVRDSGVGISAELLPSVFDLFVQERQNSDRTQGGLGIGLAIVRNLVAMHGGVVGATSGGVNQGSEFTIRLPMAESGAEVGVATKLIKPQGRRRGKRAQRILIVDDNEDAAELMSAALNFMGHETRVASDGPTSLILAEQFLPEVALLDIGLPVMDGYEVAAKLRALPGLKGMRLVAITGYGQASDRDRTQQAGFDAHLVKPVELPEIEALLNGMADTAST